MEFNKFLARESSNSSVPKSSPMVEQALQVGYLPTDPSRASDYFSNTSNLQELGMHQKREQMVAAEVKRRLQIEAEVSREMAAGEAIGKKIVAKETIEREIALQGANTSKIPILSATSTMMNHGLSAFNEFKGRLVDVVPFTRKPEDVVTDVTTSPEVKNKMSNDLPKEDKSSPPPPKPSDILPLAATKQPRCELCNILTTSEEQLKTHLQGKKHKSQELKEQCTMGILGFRSMLAISNSPKEVLKQDEEQSNNAVQRVSKIPEDVRDDGTVSEKVETKGTYPFWCVNCTMGTWSIEDMDAHVKGKKHISKVMLSKDIS